MTNDAHLPFGAALAEAKRIVGKASPQGPTTARLHRLLDHLEAEHRSLLQCLRGREARHAHVRRLLDETQPAGTEPIDQPL